MGLARRDQGARRRRCRDIGDNERHRARPQPPSARRVAAGRHRFLCPSSSAMHTDISSSSLRELDAVALATNTTISMKRATKEADRVQRSQVGSLRRCSRAGVRSAGYTSRISCSFCLASSSISLMCLSVISWTCSSPWCSKSSEISFSFSNFFSFSLPSRRMLRSAVR